MNPVLAPRQPKCPVCTLVASPEDVTIRLFGPDLTHLPTEGAVAYLRDVGLEGTIRQLQAKVLVHRRHVDRFLEAGGAVAPAKLVEGVSRIRPPVGDTRWVDVNQQGMDIGATAMQILAARLDALEPRELIAVANLGQAAAAKRADLEVKGHLRKAEQLARLAAGIRRPEPA